MARKSNTPSTAPVAAPVTRKRQPRNAATKPTEAERGVPQAYLNPQTGRFLPGRDATLKGDCTAAVLGLDEAATGRPALVAWTPKAALALLTQRGWLAHLELRKAAVERRAAKAAARKTRKAAAPKAAKKTAPKTAAVPTSQRRTRSSRKAA